MTIYQVIISCLSDAKILSYIRYVCNKKSTLSERFEIDSTSTVNKLYIDNCVSNVILYLCGASK